MAFGFPVYARGSRRYDSNPDALRETVARTLSALGWTAYGHWSGSRFVAAVGVSFWSWGEKITVDIDGESTIWVESKCRLPTQCIDWGKNRRNVNAFFELANEKSQQVGKTKQEPSGR